MAAAQVAKKLKDRRQKHTLEEIFRKVDRDGNGTISLTEYFGIFEEHGVTISQAECKRVHKIAGADGTLKKDEFIKILRSSNYFLKTFDKNQDGIVSETEMTTRAELAFKALDKDGSGYITEKEMRKLSSKLSSTELDAIMKKLDSDGDGKLTFEEFKKMFDKIDLKGRQRKDSSPGSSNHSTQIPKVPSKINLKQDSPDANNEPSKNSSPEKATRGFGNFNSSNNFNFISTTNQGHSRNKGSKNK